MITTIENLKTTRTAAKSVWQAREILSGSFVGFLVTEPGNLDRPVAMVLNVEGFEPDSGQHPQSTGEMWRLAAEVSIDHALISARPVVDLRQYGKPNSESPMPGWIYGLECREIDDDLRPNGAPLQPAPFCRFRLAMLEKHAVANGWVRPEAMPVEHPDETIWAELHNWKRTIERTAPDHPLLAKLKVALVDTFPPFDRFGGTGANPSLMRAVRNEIVRSPDKHKLLNDWAPDDLGPDPRSLYAVEAGSEGYQFLTIVPKPSSNSKTFGCLEYHLAEFEPSPVVIRVLEGTSLDEARVALLEADRYMAAHWLGLIHDMEEIGDQKTPGRSVRTLDGATRFPVDPMDMWTELEGWHRAIEESRPKSPFFKVLNTVLGIGWDAVMPPKVEDLRQVRQLFMRMNEIDRREMLNGWEPRGAEPDRGVIQEWIAQDGSWSPQNVLSLYPAMPGSNRETPHELGTIPNDGGTAPVIVHIYEGTTLDEVKARLAELDRFITAHWTQLIRGGDLKPTEREQKEAQKEEIAAAVHAKPAKRKAKRTRKAGAK
jgi:hypothetical protein